MLTDLIGKAGNVLMEPSLYQTLYVGAYVLTVLMLSIVIGYYVIGKVHHALHTPLMSVTNAISGIIVVGGLLGARGLFGLQTSVIVAIVATLSVPWSTM